MAKYFAVIFLFIYGALSLKSAFSSKSLSEKEDNLLPSVKKTILLILALSLLNPHVYLDTVVLLGSIASQQPAHELAYFAIGAIIASFAWFFTITYGSHFCAPFLRNPFCWKIIDLIVATMMWFIAITLIITM